MSALRIMFAGVGVAIGVVTIMSLTNVGVSLLSGGKHTATSLAEDAVGKVF